MRRGFFRSIGRYGGSAQQFLRWALWLGVTCHEARLKRPSAVDHALNTLADTPFPPSTAEWPTLRPSATTREIDLANARNALVFP
jgi:hypothetical protein